MNIKKILLIIIALIIIGGGAFYGGMKYTQSKGSQGFVQGNFQELRNLSSKERQQRLQGMGAPGINSGAGRTGGMGSRTGSGFASGEIISKDNQSLTIKLRNGGSKIIFYSDNTKIGKFVNGTPSDIEIGKSAIINGTVNQDGSITAESIQLR